jgi:hypothetical protein
VDYPYKWWNYDPDVAVEPAEKRPREASNPATDLPGPSSDDTTGNIPGVIKHPALTSQNTQTSTYEY